MSICTSVATYLENDDDSHWKCHTRCILGRDHDGEHVGTRTINPRPQWAYDHQVVDLRDNQ